MIRHRGDFGITTQYCIAVRSYCIVSSILLIAAFVNKKICALGYFFRARPAPLRGLAGERFAVAIGTDSQYDCIAS